LPGETISILFIFFANEEEKGYKIAIEKRKGNSI
jgi:hypothetical protein